MIKSNLCDYGNAYIYLNETITVLNTVAKGTNPNNRNKKVTYKNCVPFINCISKINNTQIDDAHDIDAAMPVYNLIEYSDNYLKASGRLWQFYRHEPALNDNNVITDFPDNKNNSNLLNVRQNITGQTTKNGTKDVEIMVPLKYLSDFLRTHEMSLIAKLVLC